MPSAAVLDGYPAANASWYDSFETTEAASSAYWKNGVRPVGWDQMWVATAPTGGAEKLYFEVTDAEAADGRRSIRIHSEDASGRICVFPMNQEGALDYNKNYILRIRVKTQDVEGTGFYFRVQVGEKCNKNVFDTSDKGKGTQDWTEYEVRMENIATLAGDTSGYFKLELFAEYITGDVWVDAVEFIPLDSSGAAEQVTWSNGFENKQVTTDTNHWPNGEAPAGFSSMGWAGNAFNGSFELDGTVKHGGNYALHYTSNANTNKKSLGGTAAIDYNQNYILRAWVKGENVVPQGNTSTWRGPFLRVQIDNKQYFATEPLQNLMNGNTFDWTPVELELTDIKAVAAEKGFTLPGETGALTVEVVFETFSGELWIDDMVLVPAGYKLELDREKASLLEGETVQLTAGGMPAGTAVAWSSSDETIATVDANGLVEAIGGGMAVITAQTDEFHSVSCTVIVLTAAMEEEFDAMRAKWTDRLTGNPYWDGANTGEEYKNILAGYEAAAETARGLLVKDSGEKLFSDLDLDISKKLGSTSTNSNDSVAYSDAVSRIQDMARAVLCDGATYIYNGDANQYADNYWNTVDSNRLAGITTDHSTWTPARYCRCARRIPICCMEGNGTLSFLPAPLTAAAALRCVVSPMQRRKEAGKRRFRAGASVRSGRAFLAGIRRKTRAKSHKPKQQKPGPAEEALSRRGPACFLLWKKAVCGRGQLTPRTPWCNRQ